MNDAKIANLIFVLLFVAMLCLYVVVTSATKRVEHTFQNYSVGSY